MNTHKIALIGFILGNLTLAVTAVDALAWSSWS